jgi:hypothetical protein
MSLWDLFGEDVGRLEKLHACSGESCQVCAADRLKVEPSLPYAGTSGWSGTDTSRGRAIDADSTGLTGERQARVIEILDERGEYGLTWKDLADILGAHHGTASGVLSVLHKSGHIARLSESRDRCKIYVLPEYVNGRECESQGRSRECPNCGHRS